MRTKWMRTTASQTTTGTTRTTCSSPSTTPMDDVDARNSDDRVVHMHWDCTHLCSQLVMSSHTSLAQVLSKHFVIHGHIHGAFSLIRPLPSSSTFPSCPSPSTSSTTSCSLSSTTRSSWQVCATPPQMRVRTPWTPSPLTQVMSPSSWPSASSTTHQSPFSFMIPSSDQDIDDLTLGEMLTAAHRGQVDYCGPEGMSVSQSSSSVMFDGSGQPDGERKGRSISKFWCHTKHD